MKKLVIGIDVSKKKIDVTAIDAKCMAEGAHVLDYQVYDNTRMGFKRMLVWARRLKPGLGADDILFCCETTGSYDHLLCDYVYAHGYAIWRESALQIKLSAGVRKGKDDKNDSRAIAEYAARHMDKASLYEPLDPAVVEIKHLLLERRRLEQERTSLKVRVNEMKSTHLKSPALTIIYRDTMKQIRDMEKMIKKYEKLITDTVKSDERLLKNYRHLTSVKGVGIINATSFLVYTNNFKNFKSSRRMASYWGVASFRERSGTSIDKRASVKHLSNSMLKSYITQAAECTIQRGGIYRDYYLRLISRGKVHGVAINNVKNKLIHLVFSLVMNDKDYEPNHEWKRKLETATII